MTLIDANRLYHSPRRYAALGLPYCFEQIPSKEDLATMLLCSPIIHAAKVRTKLYNCLLVSALLHVLNISACLCHKHNSI